MFHPFIYEALLALFIMLEASVIMVRPDCVKKGILFSPLLRKISAICLIMLMIGCIKAHLDVDIRFLHVFLNNHLNQQWYYRIASLWSHSETSLFVWLFLLNTVVWLRLKGDPSQDDVHKIRVILAAFNVAFGLYMCIDASPFTTTDPDLLQKNISPLGLNPLLHDLNMVWHPPLLYIGQALFFIPYARSLCFEDIQKTEVRYGFMVLLLAISLGAFWAFKTLGWGGFWFWDPVETASLLPFVSSLLLLHTPSVWRQQLPWVNMLPFVSVIASLWLIRSGLLQSIHSFTQSPSSFWMLGMIMIGTFLPLLAGIVRHHTLTKIQKPYLIMALIGMIMTLIILKWGILLPFLMGVQIKPQFFNQTLGPLYAFLSILAIVHVVPQKHQFFKKKSGIMGLCAGSLALYTHQDTLHGIALFVWVSGASLAAAMTPLITEKIKMATAHLGFGLFLMGCALYSQSPDDQVITFKNHDKESFVTLPPYTYVLHKKEIEDKPFLRKERLTIQMHDEKNGSLIGTLMPSVLFFHTRGEYRTESSVLSHKGIIYMISGIQYHSDQDQIIMTCAQKHGLWWILWGVLLMILSALPLKRLLNGIKARK